MAEPVQPELNIGLVGHVDHGKTTLTEQLSGKWTDTHSEELRRGITIRLGYADTIIRHCKKCDIHTVKDKCPKCKGKTDFVRKISFVDAPGHESLMATMLCGATIMDAALLLISANEECPMPQTKEHLMALEISGIKNVIIVQNKIDLVPKENVLENYKQIKAFIKGTPYEKSPIVPISAQQGVNLDILIDKIVKYFKIPKRDAKAKPLMLVARSFDINKPSSKIKDLKGGILGGSLVRGSLKIGDDIEIRPGYQVTHGGKTEWKPLRTKITGLNTGGRSVEKIGPGGSVGVMTLLDPSIIKSDSMTGSCVGYKGHLPEVRSELKLKTTLLERIVGANDEKKVDPIKIGEALMLNVNSAATVGIVTAVSNKGVSCKLKLPVCADKGARVTISRRMGNRFRLIGYGLIE